MGRNLSHGRSQMTTPALVKTIAHRLRIAQDTQIAIPAFGHQLDDHDYAAAYAIQQHNFDYWSNVGRQCIGRKIGLTSEKVQAQLGVDQPDYGALFADTEVKENGILPINSLIAPRVEAELALVLKTDLTDPDAALDDLAQAVDWVIPALEIVDSRIRDWKISILDTIADNGASANYVLGNDRKKLADINLETCQMELFKNGKPVSTGKGSDCLGNPLNALSWLARTLIAHGTPLRAGDLVLTGALGPMVGAEADDHFEAKIDTFSPVRISFS